MHIHQKPIMPQPFATVRAPKAPPATPDPSLVQAVSARSGEGRRSRDEQRTPPRRTDDAAEEERGATPFDPSNALARTLALLDLGTAPDAAPSAATDAGQSEGLSIGDLIARAATGS